MDTQEWQPGDPIYARHEEMFLCPGCAYPIFEIHHASASQCPNCGYLARLGDRLNTYRAWYIGHLLANAGDLATM